MSNRSDYMMDYLYQKAFKTNTPISVVIELLTMCNMRCEHCYIPEHNKYGFDYGKIVSLLYELRELGVFNVSLTGGEIFLREDILEIINVARKLHMRVFLLSNGTVLSSKTIDELEKLHISEFSTTLFSMDCKIHDSITGINGSFDTLMTNLEYMKKCTFGVNVKTPLMRKNFNFQPVRDYCNENGFTHGIFPHIQAKTNGDSSPCKLRIPDDIMPSVLREFDKTDRNRYLGDVDVPCASIFYSFAIDCMGNVYPCNAFFFKIGNVYKKSLFEIWNSTELEMLKKIKNDDLKKCIECTYKAECDRCPGTAYNESGDLYGCDEYSRKLSMIRLNNYIQIKDNN